MSTTPITPNSFNPILLSKRELAQYIQMMRLLIEASDDKEKQKKYAALEKELLLLLLHASPEAILLKVQEMNDLLHKDVSAGNKLITRLDRQFDEVNTSLREEMEYTDKDRARIHNALTSDIQKNGPQDLVDGKPRTWQSYTQARELAITTSHKGHITVDRSQFKTEASYQNNLVARAIDKYPPGSTVYIKRLKPKRMSLLYRTTGQDLFKTSADQEAIALAQRLTVAGFRVANLDLLPKAERQKIEKLQKKAGELEVSREENKEMLKSDESDVQLGHHRSSSHR